jgi:hypothetical protein
VGTEGDPRDVILREQNREAAPPCQLPACFREDYSRHACRYSASLAGLCSRLIKAENVRVVCGDPAQINIVRRDIRVVPTTRGPLPLLSCDRAEAE